MVTHNPTVGVVTQLGRPGHCRGRLSRPALVAGRSGVAKKIFEVVEYTKKGMKAISRTDTMFHSSDELIEVTASPRKVLIMC